MNDKEKQIEIQKMQQEIFDSCAWRFSRHPEDYREVANDIGEDLYNLGYRNCKDKVVLTREEFDEFRKDRAEVIFLKKQIIEQARKETAREFAEKLKKKLYTNNYCQEIVTKEMIQELEKQYGVIGEEV